eukprot:scaffold270_cov121-Isochrysis_galbana.AAC.14
MPPLPTLCGRRMVPPSASHRPAMQRSSDDFPTPDGPVTSSASPGPTQNETPSASGMAPGGGVEYRRSRAPSASLRNSTSAPPPPEAPRKPPPAFTLTPPKPPPA